MKKGKRPLPPSGVPDPKQPRLARDEGKACVCYPYSLSSFKLDQNIELSADPEFYVFSIGGLQNRERQIFQSHAKTISL